jgi:hypothetical protein
MKAKIKRNSETSGLIKDRRELRLKYEIFKDNPDILFKYFKYDDYF